MSGTSSTRVKLKFTCMDGRCTPESKFQGSFPNQTCTVGHLHDYISTLEKNEHVLPLE